MKIIIKRLIITNFKGIKSLDISFNHVTNIFGENAAGKTSVFDAFTWLFFGKDSTDRKDFELKPLDENGKVIQKQDVEVEAIVEVDGKERSIKRVHHEKWVKKRGDLIPEFQGNETLYYWNKVPMQMKQFNEKIAELINDHVFKLITNTLYFNSLKWQDRRQVLLGIAGEITNEELIAANPDFESLIDLLGDETLEEYKRKVSAMKKKIKDDLSAIPTRIAEINHNMPERIDFNLLRKQIEAKTKHLADIDSALQSSVKLLQATHDSISQKQTQLFEYKTAAANIKNQVRSKFADAHQERKNQIASIEREISGLKSSIQNKAFQISNTQTEIDRLSAERSVVAHEWETENVKTLVFDENEFICPTCERPLDEKKIENSKKKLEENFNTNKSKRLAVLLEKGMGLKNRIDALSADLKKFNEEHTDLNKQLLTITPKLESAIADHNRITSNSESEYKKLLDVDVEYITALKQVESLETELQQPIEEADNSELKAKKAGLNIELDALKKQLNDEDTINKNKKRIAELEEEESGLAQQLSDLEGSEYLAEQFTKAKMDTLVQRINGRFRYVTFKMFDTQINGGEVECCDTLINGVPFSDANNAGRINAGLDIINTLCEHYGVYAPIFIDNRESVNNLIDCNSQVVNLIVSTDKKLRVA